MWNHRGRKRQRQSGEERRTEVRRETSFHLATLMAAMIVSTTKDWWPTTARERDTERGGGGGSREGSGGGHFHSAAFSRTGVMFGRDQDNKTVCHREPQTHHSRSKNRSVRLEGMIWALWFFSEKVKPDWQKPLQLCVAVSVWQICAWFVPWGLSSLQCHESQPSFQPVHRLHHVDTPSNNWKKQIHCFQCFCINWALSQCRVLGCAKTLTVFADTNPGSRKDYRCFSAQLDSSAWWIECQWESIKSTWRL